MNCTTFVSFGGMRSWICVNMVNSEGVRQCCEFWWDAQWVCVSVVNSGDMRTGGRDCTMFTVACAMDGRQYYEFYWHAQTIAFSSVRMRNRLASAR
jgi:hypothetical protein